MFGCSSEVMMDNTMLYGYLTGVMVQTCCDLAMQNCCGCKVNLKSPLLHTHEQMSLLDKIHLYLNEVRGDILPKVNMVYDNVKDKLPRSDDEVKDKENFVNLARWFLQTATPELLYYARYLTDQNDHVVHELMWKPSRKRKPYNRDGNKKSKRKIPPPPVLPPPVVPPLVLPPSQTPSLSCEDMLDKLYQEACDGSKSNTLGY